MVVVVYFRLVMSGVNNLGRAILGLHIRGGC